MSDNRTVGLAFPKLPVVCTVGQTRFACQLSGDCLEGNVCRGGECRSEAIPEGLCFPGEQQSCTLPGCERPCGTDGGWQGCAPATGPAFDSNPLHCGECGRRCSERLGSSLGCIDSRCTCTRDSDCPAGDVCGLGGVCVMSTEPCAQVSCDAGAVLGVISRDRLVRRQEGPAVDHGDLSYFHRNHSSLSGEPKETEKSFRISWTSSCLNLLIIKFSVC